MASSANGSSINHDVADVNSIKFRQFPTFYLHSVLFVGPRVCLEERNEKRE